MLISLFRNHTNLHGFIKFLFQRHIATPADLPRCYEGLLDEFQLYPVSRRMFIEKLRKLAAPPSIGKGVSLAKLEPRI